jgi:hypothetical protein
MKDFAKYDTTILHRPFSRMPGKALLAVAISTGSLLLAAYPCASAFASQGEQTQAAGGRVTGTVTAVAGNVLTIKDDKGAENKVTVADSARVLQLPAGAKSLSAATPIKLQDIAVGDRVLAKITAGATGSTASLLVAMKESDIAQKQQKDRQDWQTKGISGLVKSVDASAQTVTVSTGSGPTAKTITVQASNSTNIRRYAPDSTKFDDAKTATLDQIKPGDQLRAKGEKSADGTQLTADAIVAGTFRNIAGTVVSVDAAANTVTVNDLATKKPVVVSINADSQLHTLPAEAAQRIAARLKGGPAGAGGAATPGSAPAGGAGAGSGGGGSHSWQGAAGGANGDQQGAQGQRGGDLQQALNRAPVLHLADLKKGDAVMVLTTEGQSQGAATAVTLLAGVEPLLQASPSASQSVLSASWSVGGAAPGADAQ